MARYESVKKRTEGSGGGHCTVYTDGGCWGNPGPGGWACVATCHTEEVVASGGAASTTNNRMELTAVIEGLRLLRTAGVRQAEIVTDSRYVQQGITSWIARWKTNGWRTAGKKPVKNRDLWLTLDNESSGIDIRWAWVAGHAGHPQNERCHDLVQKEIAKVQSP